MHKCYIYDFAKRKKHKDLHILCTSRYKRLKQACTLASCAEERRWAGSARAGALLAAGAPLHQGGLPR